MHQGSSVSHSLSKMSCVLLSGLDGHTEFINVLTTHTSVYLLTQTNTNPYSDEHISTSCSRNTHLWISAHNCFRMGHVSRECRNVVFVSAVMSFKWQRTPTVVNGAVLLVWLAHIVHLHTLSYWEMQHLHWWRDTSQRIGSFDIRNHVTTPRITPELWQDKPPSHFFWTC